ncbi:11110_t:CDS:10 [Entrophospora sp. SA101]|nr:11110_t:CDS:10 [Entrophospora sp. SA101]CAJ0827153.1 6099_t:CDS:10 [Entrophospora sp. SA101]CAJ0840542.1 15777_t:CDS:10 [Entrophospora sp. SA101]CAJ0900427.1 8090_t:CDS:10 [Entrophospora sp. SA101]
MRKNQQLLLQKRKPEPVVYKEIRINVEIKQSENNIFNFPDLCKEAGIDLTMPKQKYKNYHSEEPQLNEPGDDFFRRILENSEKYAEEEEEQNNRKKKRQERYDISDPFIDDSGMVPFRLDKPRPKIEGFYVWRGPLELENTNEKAPGKKRAYKRKKKDNNEEEEETRGTPKPRKKPMGDIDIVPYNIPDSIQQTSKDPSSSSSNSNALDDTQQKTLNKNRSKEHKEHKEQNNDIEPLNSELQQILSIFKDEISKESFQVKSRFPQSLKPTLIKLLSKAYELGEFNENLFKNLTNILPYNKFTITRLCYRTMYPKAIHDSRFKKTDLISQFKSSVDEAMSKLLKEYNELSKKFKWDNHIKSLLYQIIQTEMSIVMMCNQLAEAEERTERQSEQTSRKKLYQHLLAIWPDEWMSSNEIGKIYSAYKKKQQS